MPARLTSLPSGLRVLTDPVEGIDSVAVGIWAAVGTRHEDMAENGVAHMVEHMLFKGTPSRTAYQIAREIEGAGGHMNAYTSREITSYHCHLLKDDLPLALDVLADMIQNSSLHESELDLERNVILQEIGMVQDTPDDLVFDLYQEAAYPDQTLGAPILGRAAVVAEMPRETLFQYIKTHYTAENLVLCASGAVTHEDMLAHAEKLFAGLPAGTHSQCAPARYTGGEIRMEKPLEQTHIVLGFQGVARTDPDYQSACVLSTILGGGMSSRLFQEIREKRGLVYTIFSTHGSYHDDGQFAIYAGTGAEDVSALIPVLCAEIAKAAETLTEEELCRAKTQRRASYLMGRESMVRRADSQARSLIYTGLPSDPARILAEIDAVTQDSLRRTAQRLFSSAPTLSALGPLERLESYEDIRQRLSGA